MIQKAPVCIVRTRLKPPPPPPNNSQYEPQQHRCLQHIPICSKQGKFNFQYHKVQTLLPQNPRIHHTQELQSTQVRKFSALKNYKLHQIVWICNNVPQMAQSSIQKKIKNNSLVHLDSFRNRSTKPTTKNLPERLKRSRKRSRSVYLEITAASGDCHGKAPFEGGIEQALGRSMESGDGVEATGARR